MTPEDEKDYMDKLLAKIDKEFEEYYVTSGTRVIMNDKSEYVVTMIILDEDMRKKLDDGKVWKLYALVEIDAGVNFSHPVPKMSEGRVDIRELMGMGKYPVQEVTLLKMEKKDYQTIRTYKVVEERGYVTEMTVIR